MLHFGEKVELANVAPLPISRQKDVQQLLVQHLLHRSSWDVDWPEAARGLTGPPTLACLALRSVYLREGESLTQEKLETVLSQVESAYRREIAHDFHLFAGYNKNLRKALLDVWGGLTKSDDGLVMLPDPRPEGWTDIEASGLLRVECVEGKGDVVRVYPCLKSLLDKPWLGFVV